MRHSTGGRFPTPPRKPEHRSVASTHPVAPNRAYLVCPQLSALPWLGWIPDVLGAYPAAALARLAAVLAINPESTAGLLSAYGGWQGRTRRDHRAQVLVRLAAAGYLPGVAVNQA